VRSGIHRPPEDKQHVLQTPSHHREINAPINRKVTCPASAAWRAKRRIKGLTRPIFKGRLLLFALPVRNSGVGKLPQFDIFCLLAFWPAPKMPISIESGGLLPAKVTAKVVSAVLR